MNIRPIVPVPQICESSLKLIQPMILPENSVSLYLDDLKKMSGTKPSPKRVSSPDKVMSEQFLIKGNPSVLDLRKIQKDSL